MGLTRRVLDLAVKQGGYVTREQLLAHGVSPSAVDRRVNEREIDLVSPGIYRVIDSDDHIDLLRGAALALPNPVVSHQSAAHLLHFPKLPALVPTVVVASHTTHRFPGVTVRRCDDLGPVDIVRVDGLAVTSVSRTSFDLAGILEFKEFDAIGESLVIAGRLSLDAFESTSTRLARKGKRGSRASRDFLEVRAGSDRRATVLERRGRAVLRSGGLPSPIPQFPIPWRPTNRFDAAYPAVRLGIEWDSRAWHEQRSAMVADRRRDREAAANGWTLLRVTWDDIKDQPHEIVATVSKLLTSRTRGSRLR